MTIMICVVVGFGGGNEREDMVLLYFCARHRMIFAHASLPNQIVCHLCTFSSVLSVYIT